MGGFAAPCTKRRGPRCGASQTQRYRLQYVNQTDKKDNASEIKAEKSSGSGCPSYLAKPHQLATHSFGLGQELGWMATRSHPNYIDRSRLPSHPSIRRAEIIRRDSCLSGNCAKVQGSPPQRTLSDNMCSPCYASMILGSRS